MTEFWNRCEGAIINGVYPLRRLIGASDHSGVFLTEYKPQHLANAAIKIISADPTLAAAQFSHLKSAVALSHPHLIRLLDVGACQLGEQPCLFVAMEYAEETLSELLPHRTLTVDEVRELLRPTLDALGFLHRKNLVHGQIKPSNVLVVDEQLKLASDGIRPADGNLSAAADVWALGATLIEALTQHPPDAALSLPTNLPPTFEAAIRRCLSLNPADRPTVDELEVQFQIKPAPAAVVATIPQPVESPAIGRIAPPKKPTPLRRSFPSIAVVLVIVIALVIGLRAILHKPHAQPTAAGTAPVEPQPAAAPAIEPQTPGPPMPAAPKSSAASPGVLHAEIPDVARSASDTIHGHFNVVVRVTVDRSGNVIDESLEDPGPSKYFARLASVAARKWKFASANNPDSREWLVGFEFSRDGTTGHATTP